MPRTLSPLALTVATMATTATVLAGLGTPTALAAPPIPPTQYVITDADVVPEGIDVLPNGTLYVGSIGTGQIYTGRLGQTEPLRVFATVDQTQNVVLGVHADKLGRVWAATWNSIVTLDADGQQLHRFAPGGQHAFNDLLITTKAAFASDQATGVVWRAPLDGDEIGEFTPWLDLTTLFPDVEASAIAPNGLVASRNGKTLIVATNGPDALVRVDAASGEASVIDTAGPFSGDGLELKGDLLYAIQGEDVPAADRGLYVLRLDRDWTTATQVASVTGQFDFPTTLGLAKHQVLIVNSQMGSWPGTPPYVVSAIPDPCDRNQCR